MKSFLSLLIFSAALLVSGCASSGSSAEATSRPSGYSVQIHNPNLGLDEYLKRLSGVRVYGAGINARVQMRGKSSLELSSEPLFVLDDVRLGRDFNQVYKVVDMHTVNELKAFHSSKATLYYGHDGYAGVIQILTQNQ